MHCTVLALELRISDAKDVARADLIVLRYAGIRHVTVDQCAVGTCSDRKKSILERAEELVY